MKGDKLVIESLLDSMIMNYLKSPIRLNYAWIFCLRKKPYLLYIFHWSYDPPTTMESNLRGKHIRLGWDEDTIPVYSC